MPKTPREDGDESTSNSEENETVVLDENLKTLASLNLGDAAATIKDQFDLGRERFWNMARMASAFPGLVTAAHLLLESPAGSGSTTEALYSGSRFVVGSFGVLVYGFIMNRLAEKVVQKNLKSGIQRNSYNVLGGAAWCLPLLTLAGIYKDIKSNALVVNDIVVHQQTEQNFHTDPASIPAFLQIGVDFQKDVISSLDNEGQMTPKAEAKLALYFDAQQIEQDVVLSDPSLVYESWNFVSNGSEWEVNYMGNEGWYVSGPRHSYAVGGDAQGSTGVQMLEADLVKRSVASHLRQILVDSTLVDGKTTIDEFVLTMGTQPSLPADFGRGMGNLHAVLPYEWNQFHREQVLAMEQADYGKLIDQLSSLAGQVREAQFGVSALDKPHSYASTLNLINNVQ